MSSLRKRRRSLPTTKQQASFLDKLSKELEDEMLLISSTCPSSTEPEPGTRPLTYLPTDILLRIFSFLQGHDVCIMAVVCRDMSPLCKSREVWSNLYVRRWPVYIMAQDLSGAEWRTKYRKKHEKEMLRLSKGCPPKLLPYFVQMKQAQINSKKRDLNEFTIIEQWLDKHPMARNVSQYQRENHLCSNQNCKYYHVNELYICEQTGKTHFCGSACNSQRDNGDSLICIVSGRIFDSESSAHLQEPGVKIGIAIGMEGAENLDGDGDDDDGDSFLARCYSYGYSCSSEVEYQRVLDAVLPR